MKHCFVFLVLYTICYTQAGVVGRTGNRAFLMHRVGERSPLIRKGRHVHSRDPRTEHSIGGVHPNNKDMDRLIHGQFGSFGIVAQAEDGLQDSGQFNSDTVSKIYSYSFKLPIGFKSYLRITYLYFDFLWFILIITLFNLLCNCCTARLLTSIYIFKCCENDLLHQYACNDIQSRDCSAVKDCSCLGLYTCSLSRRKCRLKGLSRHPGRSTLQSH